MTTTVASVDNVVLAPAAPLTMEESGLGLELLLQLCLQSLFFAGELSGTELASRLGLH